MRRLQRWIAASGAGLIGALALGLIPPARAGGGVGFCADALRPGQADRS